MSDTASSVAISLEIHGNDNQGSWTVGMSGCDDCDSCRLSSFLREEQTPFHSFSLNSMNAAQVKLWQRYASRLWRGRTPQAFILT